MNILTNTRTNCESIANIIPQEGIESQAPYSNSSEAMPLGGIGKNQASTLSIRNLPCPTISINSDLVSINSLAILSKSFQESSVRYILLAFFFSPCLGVDPPRIFKSFYFFSFKDILAILQD
jgi:hypothetical protein